MKNYIVPIKFVLINSWSPFGLIRKKLPKCILAMLFCGKKVLIGSASEEGA